MSARNNEERSGANPSATTPPPEMVSPTTAETSPLEFSTPTEFVDLPSKGRFYSSDHPLHGVESIEIRYMTAKDEDILTSKSLLKKGIAIDRLLQNIIIDKKVKVTDLLIGDKNALVVAARITGYGAEYLTKVNCPACLEVQQHQFDLEEHALTDGGTSAVAEDVGNGVWEVICPRSNVAVGLRLLTGRDEKSLMATEQMRKKNNLPDAAATSNLKLIIATVNGNAEVQTIAKFINAMPAQDARFLRNTYDDLMPNIDLTQHFECQNCGFDMDMEVPFTTDFFWPKQ